MNAPKLKPFPKRKNINTCELDQRDKLVINQLKDLITDKIKRPEFAKKAARIIEEMLGK